MRSWERGSKIAREWTKQQAKDSVKINEVPVSSISGDESFEAEYVLDARKT